MPAAPGALAPCAAPLRHDLLALLCLASVLALVFWPLASGQAVPFFFDLTEFNIPVRHFYAQALRAGQLPLWCDGLFNGYPLFAEGQAGALFPLHALGALFASPWHAAAATLLVALLVLAAGVYALLRCFVGPLAASAGALGYTLSGAVLAHHFHTPLLAAATCLPWLLWLWERCARRVTPAGLTLATLLVAVLHLAGHPQTASTAALASGLWVLCRGLAHGGPRRALLLVVLLAASLLLGTILALPQLAPTLELAELSSRAGSLSLHERTLSSWPPAALLALLLPHAFGSLAHGTALGFAHAYAHEIQNYLGVLFLPLGALALLWRDRRAVATFVALLLVFGLLAAGDATPLFGWLTDLPILSSFRVPARLALVLNLGAAGLIALGLQVLLSQERCAPARRAAWLVPLAWATALVLPAGALWLSHRDVQAALWGANLHSPLRLELMHDLALRGAILALALVLAWLSWQRRGAGLAFPLPGGRSLPPAPLALALVALLAVDLGLYAAQAVPLLPAGWVAGAPAAARQVKRLDHEGLVAVHGCRPLYYRNGWARLGLEQYRPMLDSLLFNIPLLYELRAIDGLTPLRLRHHLELLNHGKRNPHDYRLLGARWLVRCDGQTAAGTSLVQQHPGVGLWRIDEPLPRARLVARARWVDGQAQALQALRALGTAQRETVVLERPRPTSARRAPGLAAASALFRAPAAQPAGPPVDPPRCDRPGTARITRAEHELVELQADSECGGWLVLLDTDYPGWRASVDGQEAPILRADVAFRAVPLPPGQHQVRFRFVSDSFRRGLAASLAGLVAGALALALWALTSGRRRRRAARSAPTVPGRPSGAASPSPGPDPR